MRNYKIAVAGTGYVGLSLGVLLSQHHQVVAVDIVQAKVDMINNKKSPIQDDYMPELLDELNIARSNGSLKKLMKAYKKVELLILDEWLIRPLTSQESYDLLEIAEARSSRSTIFCTQYQPEGWYTRIDPDPESQSPISEAIMDRIIHNSYEILVEGRVSMRERKGLRAASLKNDKTDA